MCLCTNTGWGLGKHVYLGAKINNSDELFVRAVSSFSPMLIIQLTHVGFIFFWTLYRYYTTHSTFEMEYALSSEITLNLLHINGIRFQPSVLLSRCFK